ncbi:MAG TPA: ROK family protein [Candidatus Cryptobacteroides merdipullorum]|uniref:ROK family protein n=1 Tax=Candidatus Cryptobacteroides merdipullorum TaxID=2840771 RepID=A0A9D1KI10_9BACT|nr:ROK family protein [Candidatus Cryptobacteroides merdipullorum]
MEKQYVVGVDVGGQTSKIGVVNARGEILSRLVIRSDSYGKDSGAYISALAEAIRACVAECGKTGEIRGVGVGAPNSNYYTGQISYATNIEWAADGVIDFAKLLSESLGGVAVSLTNDANAAAMGEMTYGVARGMKNFIMITLGTGVGSGIVIDGKVVYGHDGNAGELGHTCAVRYNGRPCGCGKTGCLEAYCSAIGVARTAREMLELTDEPSLLRGVEDLSSKSVYEAAVEGDALALRIFDYTGKMLGRSFADFVAFSAPEAIVLFGGLARAKEFFYEPMLQSMNENLMHQWKGKVKIVFSQLKESDAAILGASALAWEL